MRPLAAPLLALALAPALSGCLGLGPAELVWTVVVQPFDTGRWAVDLPMPVGVAPAETLVPALALEGARVDVRVGETADGQRFLRLLGRGASTLTATVDAPEDANVTWAPTLRGEPIGRVEVGPTLRVVESWRIGSGDACRGEAIGLLGAAGNTTAMTRVDGPC